MADAPPPNPAASAAPNVARHQRQCTGDLPKVPYDPPQLSAINGKPYRAERSFVTSDEVELCKNETAAASTIGGSTAASSTAAPCPQAVTSAFSMRLGRGSLRNIANAERITRMPPHIPTASHEILGGGLLSHGSIGKHQKYIKDPNSNARRAKYTYQADSLPLLGARGSHPRPNLTTAHKQKNTTIIMTEPAAGP
eukprot:CAMPEP_0183708998 /NCGR_PEP_ID=MMETSP0737-20130205/5147_1 /TAXON_ID=385413 /ORGANISM="Thalassiosira miniscula, Strain CCMP1093" /LENGTH=195 /DNA_ID=CAMNT_0025936987 /DNA_START=20 /DNA_END=609 /DNA_ORIENTATION=-